MKLLFKLLRKNVYWGQLMGFALANVVGAVIILFGSRAYGDALKLMDSSRGLFSSDFVVLSKPVSSVSTFVGALGYGPKTFSDVDVAALEQVKGVSRVEKFRTAAFPVYGVVSLGDFEVSTEMFIESVPDDFLELKDDVEWTASTDSRFVPMVVPRAYLNFYNYGFAAARGMPQIGESLFAAVPVRLIARGPAEQVVYEGKIVGFTNNLNTILVPDDFLVEANLQFAPNSAESVTRVIVESDGSSTDELMTFIAEHNYVVDGNGDVSMRLLSIVRIVIGGVVAVGVIVVLLAFYLLLISILLMVEKNRYKNNVLHQLGYSDARISFPYQVLAVAVDVFVWVIALAVTLWVYPLAVSFIQKISPGFVSLEYGTTVLLSLLLCAFFVLIHVCIIRRKIR